jgi:hypothetical protein
LFDWCCRMFHERFVEHVVAHISCCEVIWAKTSGIGARFFGWAKIHETGQTGWRETLQFFFFNVRGSTMIYPLVNIYITMENHHFEWENSLYMAIFYSFLYVDQRVHRIFFKPLNIRISSRGAPLESDATRSG